MCRIFRNHVTYGNLSEKSSIQRNGKANVWLNQKQTVYNTNPNIGVVDAYRCAWKKEILFVWNCMTVHIKSKTICPLACSVVTLAHISKSSDEGLSLDDWTHASALHYRHVQSHNALLIRTAWSLAEAVCHIHYKPHNPGQVQRQKL